jgi:EAL domain-containing protein (putative c-di-GMP-specific phosphodiesterase class I)
VTALRQLGCDDAQGFYFCRPLPPNELSVLLHSWTQNERQ